MRTVREWIKFLANDKTRFGLELKGGLSPRKRFYFPAEEFLIRLDGWLDEKVIEVYLNNYVDPDGTTYTLLVWQQENN